MKTNYFFTCSCGCGQMSENLGKDYIKLRKSQKWYAKGCEGKREILQEFKGGNIVKEEDF